MQARPGHRIPALLALLLPVGAGLIYLAIAGAPQTYIITNSVALIMGGIWIMVGRAPAGSRLRRILICALLFALFIPLISGPYVNGIARWLPAGPFTLNAGALLFPAIAVLAAQDDDFAPPMLLAALLAAMLQPDAALGFAVVFAAVGLHDAARDWRIGVTCIIGFLASIVMALRGELPPQPFVERVLVTLAQTGSLIALLLFAALLASFCLMLFALPQDRRSRAALAGSLFGFSIMSVLSHYPSVLIGYGAAPILGYALALGLIPRIGDAARAN
ncbi:hypothetical protein GRI43_02595 [Altererythrobacter luteolus]|uniref:Uncharacterized protein n=1 Tax=Pontixanthobacter luteolus TaxID=295089 RepID=A0A6I4V2U7_9SPHN|nr:hypothetical protein [Pontixanthobacter luteolus]MXP46282.1 hypothetical protein [Pontixanthobacter luteolus]